MYNFANTETIHKSYNAVFTRHVLISHFHITITCYYNTVVHAYLNQFPLGILLTINNGDQDVHFNNIVHDVWLNWLLVHAKSLHNVFDKYASLHKKSLDKCYFIT